jgi:hypothetical protein
LEDELVLELSEELSEEGLLIEPGSSGERLIVIVKESFMELVVIEQWTAVKLTQM